MQKREREGERERVIIQNVFLNNPFIYSREALMLITCTRIASPNPRLASGDGI